MQGLEKAIQRAFKEGLPACMGEEFEDRKGQVEMASQIGRALARGRIAVVEAGTGLGKSLAYLIPLLLYCHREKKRAAVSTFTRTLQHQLVDKDFPQALEVSCVDLEGAILMGRANYACKRAILSLAGRTKGTGRINRRILREILEEPSGELERVPRFGELTPGLRSAVKCPWKEAMCSGCGMRDECFLFQARKRALSSDIVFVNHSLLLSNLLAKGSLLGPQDILVIDEAHHLQDVATDFFTITLSPQAIKGSDESLLSNAHEEILGYACTVTARALPEDAEEIERLRNALQLSLGAADGLVKELFALLTRNAREALEADRERNEQSHHEINLGYREGSPLFYGTDEISSRARGELQEAARLAGEICEMASLGKGSPESPVSVSLRAFSEASREAAEGFDFLVSGSNEDYVFFAKLNREGEVLSLSASPVDVSSQLGALLEESCGGVVITSATLAVDKDFSYTLRSLGLSGCKRVETHFFESPFDVEKQMLVQLASYLPSPSEKGFLEEAASTVASVAEETDKKMLVLCTSRRQLEGLGFYLSESFGLGGRIIAQKEGASRNEIAASFRRGKKKILLGLASFWEGVDFPGKLLEIVVVVKMPFLVPTEPIVRARAKRLEAGGENPFEAFFLPDVVIKLKQGFGRLIRTSLDAGVVIVLDSRLAGKEYGAFVLRALSGRVSRYECLEELIDGLKKFFSGSGLPNHKKAKARNGEDRTGRKPPPA